MAEHRLDAFFGHARTIYYFTGALLAAETPAALVIERDGRSILLSPDGKLRRWMCVPVETYSISRVVADAHADAARLLKDRIEGNRIELGREFSYTPAALLNSLSSNSVTDAGPLLRFLRKRKDEREDLPGSAAAWS